MRKLAFFGGSGDPLKEANPPSRCPALLFPTDWPTITVLTLKRDRNRVKCRLSAHCGRGLGRLGVQ